MKKSHDHPEARQPAKISSRDKINIYNANDSHKKGFHLFILYSLFSHFLNEKNK